MVQSMHHWQAALTLSTTFGIESFLLEGRIETAADFDLSSQIG
jgi:hypothetical protein